MVVSTSNGSMLWAADRAVRGRRLVAALGEQQALAVAGVGPPGCALDGDLVHGRRPRVLPHAGQLLGHLLVRLGVVRGDLVDLGQQGLGLTVVQLQRLGRGEQAHRLQVVRLAGQDPADDRGGLLGLLLLEQVAGLEQVGVDRLRVDRPHDADGPVAAVEVVLRHGDLPGQRHAVHRPRVGGQGLLELLLGVVGVVVRQVVVGGRHVGRPVPAVDHVVRLDEHVQDGVVQPGVGLVPAGEHGPPVQGLADRGRVGRGRRVVVEQLLALAPPSLEVVLRGGGEPPVGVLGGGDVVHPLGDPAQLEVAAEGVGMTLEVVAEQGDRLGRPAGGVQHHGPVDLDHRVVGHGRVGHGGQGLVGPAQRQQGLELQVGQRHRPDALVGRLHRPQRLHGQLVPAGGDLQLGLVPVVEVVRVGQRRQVLGDQRVDPLAGDRLAREVDAERRPGDGANGRDGQGDERRAQ